MNIKFPNVSVWDRNLFKVYDKYVVMKKFNGIRKQVINEKEVFDCEELDGKLIILDCYKVFGMVQDEKPFLERLRFAKAWVNRTKNPNYEVIEPLDIPNLKTLFIELSKTDLEDEVDGLVLRNKFDSFQKSRVYKLKTAKMSTIDFFIKDSKLLVWKNKELVQFEFEDFPKTFEVHPLIKTNFTQKEIEEIEKLQRKNLNGKIVEMTWDGEHWQPLRIRTDKTRPNKLKFAISNAMNIKYPITFETAFDNQK